jgi:hypothetical protein
LFEAIELGERVRLFNQLLIVVQQTGFVDPGFARLNQYGGDAPPVVIHQFPELLAGNWIDVIQLLQRHVEHRLVGDRVADVAKVLRRRSTARVRREQDRRVVLFASDVTGDLEV